MIHALVYLFATLGSAPLAEGNQLVTNGGQATAAGIWLLTGFAAIAALGFTGNQIFGMVLKRKQLNAPAVGQQQIITQPLIVALEKEFINRAEYERRHSDIENRVKEVSKYAHEEVHAIRTALQAMQSGGELRDQMLHKLDERTIGQTRQLTGLDTKLDRITDRLADKVETILKNSRRP